MSDAARDLQDVEPMLTAVVVHWRAEAELKRLVAAWPRDPRTELLVLDNSDSATDLPTNVRRVVPATNLGFGGGVDEGARQARGRYILMLNPDARPEPGAVELLLTACEEMTDAAGIVPALFGLDGESQHRWQLRPLPKPHQLVLQGFRLIGVRGLRRAPSRGTPIPQPAAAALLLRREVLAAIGGFDRRFFPAWFEDVDLARRLADAGHILRYAPEARFVHEGAASVPALGFGRFLWLYYRHMVRYLERHHGRFWAAMGRSAVAVGMVLRVVALPLRRPRQATSRRDAAGAFLLAAWGAISGWRQPRTWREAFRTEATPIRTGTES